jgi:Leucine-rich repeat (LRR) protein
VFVKHNQIITRDLPYICKLSSLIKADLSHNNIHFLPKNIGLLGKLMYLWLDHN